MALDWQRIVENVIVSVSVSGITGVVIATVTLVATVFKLKRDVRAVWDRLRKLEGPKDERQKQGEGS